MILDRSALDQFTLGDRALEAELLGTLLTTADRYVAQMHRSATDPDTFKRAAHALKGASAGIGARRLADRAAQAERAGPDAALVAAVTAELSALRALVSSLPGAS